MQRHTVLKAKYIAKSFIEQASEVLKKMNESGTCELSGTVESAQLRRTSMDLTRALARMRNATWPEGR